MPNFDLRGIKIAKYVNTSGTITYTGPQSIGDAMECNLELKFAEGRLYAESALAEYMKLATGGTISIGAKYIPAAAQTAMYGCAASTRTANTKTITGLKYTAKDAADYVGVAFYAPDVIDGVAKYSCVHIRKALFSPPAMQFTTKGDSLKFSTPTTTGEFLADDSTAKEFFETGVADSEADAIAWVTEVLE